MIVFVQSSFWSQFSACTVQIFYVFFIGKVVTMLAMLVYKFYGEELREMFEYEDHPYAFYGMSSMSSSLPLILIYNYP